MKSTTVRDPLPPGEKAAWSLRDLEAVGVGGRVTVWRLERDDPTFPRAILIRGLKRWLPDEVREWLRSRPRAGVAA